MVYTLFVDSNWM